MSGSSAGATLRPPCVRAAPCRSGSPAPPGGHVPGGRGHAGVGRCGRRVPAGGPGPAGRPGQVRGPGRPGERGGPLGPEEPYARAAGQPDQDADRPGRPGQPGAGRRDRGLAGGSLAGPPPGHAAWPEAHRRPGPHGPDDRVRQRRGGDAGRGGRRVGGPLRQGHGRRVGAARPAGLVLAQPARPGRPRPPLDRLRPGHPGPGRAGGPLAGPGCAQAPRGLRHTERPPAHAHRPLPVPARLPGRGRGQDRLHRRRRPLPGRRRHPKRADPDRGGPAHPDNAGDAGRMLDWGFGRGRSARTVLRLPDRVAPASVASLLTRPPATVERHHPANPETLAGAGLAKSRPGPPPVPGPAGPRPLVRARPPASGHRRRRCRGPAGRRRARHPQTPPAD